MSVVDKEVLLEPFTSDRIGHLAFRAYVAVLAVSHVTRSDGTLPFDDQTIRWGLLTGCVAISAEDLAGIRAQLEELGLVVPYSAGPTQYAFVPKWWHYNTRPDRARRATRTSLIPDEVLAKYPTFGATYRTVPLVGERATAPAKATSRRHVPRKDRGIPGESRNAPVPEPEPEPEPEPAPVPASIPIPVPASETVKPRVAVSREGLPTRHSTKPGFPISKPDDVVERYLGAHVQRWGEPYRAENAEWGKAHDLWNSLPVARRNNLLDGIDAYVGSHHDATLGGFCEWYGTTR